MKHKKKNCVCMYSEIGKHQYEVFTDNISVATSQRKLGKLLIKNSQYLLPMGKKKQQMIEMRHRKGSQHSSSQSVVGDPLRDTFSQSMKSNYVHNMIFCALFHSYSSYSLNKETLQQIE